MTQAKKHERGYPLMRVSRNTPLLVQEKYRYSVELAHATPASAAKKKTAPNAADIYPS